MGLFLGPTAVQADSPPTCQFHDLELVPRSGEPPDFWEQREHPEISGKYVPLDEGFAFKFNSNVDATLGAQNISITGEAPKKDGKWLACGSAEAEGVALETHQVQLAVFNYLGMKNYLVVYHGADPFVFNCKYTIKITKDKPLKDDHCLVENFEKNFYTPPDNRTPFQRETMDVEYDLPTGEIRSFRIKPAVTIRPNELWSHYQDEIGWRLLGFGLDNIVQVGDPRDIPGSSGIQSIQFQQQYKGIPVEGGGFVVQTKDGFVRSVQGRFIRKINLETGSPIAESTALEAAKKAVGAQLYVWDSKPNLFSPPKGRLVIVSDGTSATAESFRLAWRFEISAEQPLVSEEVTINAADASQPPLSQSSLIWHFIEPTVDDMLADPIEEIQGSGFPLFDSPGTPPNPKTDFTVSKYMDPEGVEYVALQSRKQKPRILTLYENEYGHLQPIYDTKNSAGEFVFDGATGKPPGQIAGVSLFWAALKAVQFVYNLFGEDPNGPIAIFPQAPLFMIASNNPKRFASTEEPAFMMLKCYTLAENSDMKDRPCLFFNLNLSPILKPPVSPEAVGHEIYHSLNASFSPDLRETYINAPVLEGLANVFGKLIEFFIRGDLATWIVGKDIDQAGLGYFNLASPEESPSQMLPSTYGGELYKLIDESCQGSSRCGAERKSTVVGHAFYLMIHGQPAGTLNDLGCSAEVRPFDPDPAVARKKAGILLWRITSTYLGSYPDFGPYALRDASLNAALEPYGDQDFTDADYPPEVATVADAFHAVGIGNAAESHKLFEIPSYAKEKVEPWPAAIGVGLPSGSPSQQVQISTSLNFDENVQQKGLTPSTLLDDVGSPHAVQANTFFLNPNAHYYWRYREEPQDPNQAWGKCGPIAHFYTASKAPQLITPEPPTRLVQLREAGSSGSGGSTEIVHTLAYGESIKWEPVDGATKYFYRISESPDDLCGPKDNDTWAAYLSGTSFKPEVHDIRLLPEKTYYLYLKAIAVDDQREIEGDCTNGGVGVPFKTTKIPAPTLSSPSNGTALEYQETAYNGTAFTWEPPANWTPPADSEEKYRLTIYHRREDGSAGDTITGTDVTGRTTTLRGYYSENGYCWSVHVIAPDKSAGDESAVSCYSIHISAPEIVHPYDGAFGFYAPRDNNYAASFTWRATGGFFPEPDKNGFHITIYNLNSDGTRGGLKYENDLYSQDVTIDNSASFQYYVKIAGISDNHYGLCWSIHAFVNNGSLKSDESPVACYAMLMNRPTDLSPSGTGLDYGIVQFQWKDDNAPRGYTLTLTGSSGGSWHVDHDLTTDIQTASVNGIKADGKYDWSITALSPDPNNPDLTESAHFETKKEEQPPEPKPTTKPTTPPCTPPAAPATPSGSYPGNYGECTWMLGVYSNYFSWFGSPGATHYKIQIYAGTTLYKEPVYEKASVCTDDYTCLSPLIEPFYSQVCYTWTVMAGTEGCGQISWSQPDQLPLSFAPY